MLKEVLRSSGERGPVWRRGPVPHGIFQFLCVVSALNLELGTGASVSMAGIGRSSGAPDSSLASMLRNCAQACEFVNHENRNSIGAANLAAATCGPTSCAGGPSSCSAGASSAGRESSLAGALEDGAKLQCRICMMEMKPGDDFVADCPNHLSHAVHFECARTAPQLRVAARDAAQSGQSHDPGSDGLGDGLGTGTGCEKCHDCREVIQFWRGLEIRAGRDLRALKTSADPASTGPASAVAVGRVTSSASPPIPAKNGLPPRSLSREEAVALLGGEDDDASSSSSSSSSSNASESENPLGRLFRATVPRRTLRRVCDRASRCAQTLRGSLLSEPSASATPFLPPQEDGGGSDQVAARKRKPRGKMSTSFLKRHYLCPEDVATSEQVPIPEGARGYVVRLYRGRVPDLTEHPNEPDHGSGTTGGVLRGDSGGSQASRPGSSRPHTWHANDFGVVLRFPDLDHDFNVVIPMSRARTSLVRRERSQRTSPGGEEGSAQRGRRRRGCCSAWQGRLLKVGAAVVGYNMVVRNQGLFGQTHVSHAVKALAESKLNAAGAADFCSFVAGFGEAGIIPYWLEQRSIPYLSWGESGPHSPYIWQDRDHSTSDAGGSPRGGPGNNEAVSEVHEELARLFRQQCQVRGTSANVAATPPGSTIGTSRLGAASASSLGGSGGPSDKNVGHSLPGALRTQKQLSRQVYTQQEDHPQEGQTEGGKQCPAAFRGMGVSSAAGESCWSQVLDQRNPNSWPGKLSFLAEITCGMPEDFRSLLGPSEASGPDAKPRVLAARQAVQSRAQQQQFRDPWQIYELFNDMRDEPWHYCFHPFLDQDPFVRDTVACVAARTLSSCAVSDDFPSSDAVSDGLLEDNASRPAKTAYGRCPGLEDREAILVQDRWGLAMAQMAGHGGSANSLSEMHALKIALLGEYGMGNTIGGGGAGGACTAQRPCDPLGSTLETDNIDRPELSEVSAHRDAAALRSGAPAIPRVAFGYDYARNVFWRESPRSAWRQQHKPGVSEATLWAARKGGMRPPEVSRLISQFGAAVLGEDPGGKPGSKPVEAGPTRYPLAHLDVVLTHSEKPGLLMRAPAVEGTRKDDLKADPSARRNSRGPVPSLQPASAEPEGGVRKNSDHPFAAVVRDGMVSTLVRGTQEAYYAAAITAFDSVQRAASACRRATAAWLREREKSSTSQVEDPCDAFRVTQLADGLPRFLYPQLARHLQLHVLNRAHRAVVERSVSQIRGALRKNCCVLRIDDNVQTEMSPKGNVNFYFAATAWGMKPASQAFVGCDCARLEPSEWRRAVQKAAASASSGPAAAALRKAASSAETVDSEGVGEGIPTLVTAAKGGRAVDWLAKVELQRLRTLVAGRSAYVAAFPPAARFQRMLRDLDALLEDARWLAMVRTGSLGHVEVRRDLGLGPRREEASSASEQPSTSASTSLFFDVAKDAPVPGSISRLELANPSERSLTPDGHAETVRVYFPGQADLVDGGALRGPSAESGLSKLQWLKASWDEDPMRDEHSLYRLVYSILWHLEAMQEGAAALAGPNSLLASGAADTVSDAAAAGAAGARASPSAASITGCVAEHLGCKSFQMLVDVVNERTLALPRLEEYAKAGLGDDAKEEAAATRAFVLGGEYAGLESY